MRSGRRSRCASAPDGSTAVFPHFVLDRSKPGTVCVDQTGRRFVNEFSSYHCFARAMFEANRTRPCIPCFLITDSVGHVGLWARHGAHAHQAISRLISTDGYLIKADTIDELAAKLEVDPANLAATIETMNAYAETGVDPEFGRGTTAYHRVNGDAAHGPNPTLGPIAKRAVLRRQALSRRHRRGQRPRHRRMGARARPRRAPIEGLWACGAEAASIMGGTYPGPGITIGPAIVFAYRAVQDALRRARRRHERRAQTRLRSRRRRLAAPAGLSTASPRPSSASTSSCWKRHDQIGGTTAWSGGWMWIPRNPLAVEAGIVEDAAGAARLSRSRTRRGLRSRARIDVFLEQGPRMVAFFRDHTQPRLRRRQCDPGFP